MQIIEFIKLQEYPHQSNLHKIADTTGISHGSISTIVHQQFSNDDKVCMQWVLGTVDQKMRFSSDLIKSPSKVSKLS